MRAFDLRELDARGFDADVLTRDIFDARWLDAEVVADKKEGVVLYRVLSSSH